MHKLINVAINEHSQKILHIYSFIFMHRKDERICISNASPVFLLEVFTQYTGKLQTRKSDGVVGNLIPALRYWLMTSSGSARKCGHVTVFIHSLI